MADYDYALPERAIAQVPAEPRDSARLLVAAGEGVRHHRVRDLPGLLHPGDVVVVNDTRVLPARLHLRKASGGAAEVLLLEPEEKGARCWRALIRPARRLPPGTVLYAPDGQPLVEVGDSDDGGATRRVTLLGEPWPYGEIPLPPYLHRALADPERYQTVYAARPASVAAPTAGLHLTDGVLRALAERGIEVARVELVVGLDTFRPVVVEAAEEHRMHSEAYRVPPTTWESCTRARAEGRRVVAIGTTTVRALEAAARSGLTGRTDLFIRGDYEFEMVDVLLTNFHLPRSTLLLLVEAFAGPGWREAYRTALADGYRFLSFGDAMLVTRAALAG